MTNQVNTLTNQDVMLDLYKIHAYIPNDAAGNILTPFGNFCEGYESATKASEKRITELQAHVNQLREAGQAVVERWDSPNWSDGTHTRDYIDALRKAISSTPENKIE